MHMKTSILALTITILGLGMWGCDEGGGSKCTNPAYVLTQISVKWTLNGVNDGASSTSSFDNCLDYDAIYADILITGPDEFVYETTVTCNSLETKLYDDSCNQFPAGSYTVSVTLLDKDSLPMTGTATGTGMVSVSTDNPSIVVDFPLETFIGYETMTGTYRFNPTFEGALCADASPVVDSLDIAFYKDGVYLEDFQYNGPCTREFDISDLPAGDLQMDIVALDATPQAIYCGSYDIKVGAGVSNPVFYHDLTLEGCMVNK